MDSNGRLSGINTLLAGLGAGVAESALAVTPFESIKTQLIDDKKSPNPRMRGFTHGTGVLLREKGSRALFQGFFPTTARQAANSSVRFTVYTTLKQYYETNIAPAKKVESVAAFTIGAAAGIITV